ncbi:MAG: hypothetical protein MK116_08455 [Phycisphaerales bacterium]|nr:hypothetical protein [Phycisphaerales bacterium]
MNIATRLGWTLWALVPVAVLAYHFGPGQVLMARDIAASRQDAALQLEQDAIAAQTEAYARHLVTIEARVATFLPDATPGDQLALDAAVEAERHAYKEAADRWEVVASTYEQVEEQLVGADEQTLAQVRWSKARARVRSGAIWDGAAELESLLYDLEDSARPEQQQLALATREELAAAHYFGARLLRLEGKPADQWRPQAIKARQHFRFLAETASRDGASRDVIRGLEDNVERTINLEQMDHSELEGRPLPRQSPRAARGGGPRPGNRPGITQRPPGERDGRGASGVGPIGPGW